MFDNSICNVILCVYKVIKKGVQMGYNEIIKKIRQTKKLTQQELANILGVGQSVLASWESGARTPSYKNQRIIDSYCVKNKIKL